MPIIISPAIAAGITHKCLFANDQIVFGVSPSEVFLDSVIYREIETV